MKRPLRSKGCEYIVKGQQAKEIIEELYKGATQAEKERLKKAQHNRIKRRAYYDAHSRNLLMLEFPQSNDLTRCERFRISQTN